MGVLILFAFAAQVAFLFLNSCKRSLNMSRSALTPLFYLQLRSHVPKSLYLPTPRICERLPPFYFIPSSIVTRFPARCLMMVFQFDIKEGLMTFLTSFTLFRYFLFVACISRPCLSTATFSPPPSQPGSSPARVFLTLFFVGASSSSTSIPRRSDSDSACLPPFAALYARFESAPFALLRSFPNSAE